MKNASIVFSVITTVLICVNLFANSIWLAGAALLCSIVSLTITLINRRK